MTRREALVMIGNTSLPLLFCPKGILFSNLRAAENPTMTAPAHIRHFTADNPGYMTLQGTNQYVVGREGVLVIDVALSTGSNLDGIIEQVEALGGKKID